MSLYIVRCVRRVLPRLSVTHGHVGVRRAAAKSVRGPGRAQLAILPTHGIRSVRKLIVLCAAL